MEETRRLLRLVDDPVARTLGMLEGMPLESAVACLQVVTKRADRLGLLSGHDKARLDDLLAQVLITRLDKAA